MEALTIIEEIPSIAQLVELIHKLTSGIITSIDHIQEHPDEIWRLKLTLQSLKAKLNILGLIFMDPSNKLWLSYGRCNSFKTSLLEVQNDVETVANIIKGYELEMRGTSSLRKKLHFKLSDHKTLAKCMKHLKSSEKNLERMENSIHLYMMTLIYRDVGVRSNGDPLQRPIQCLSQRESHTVRSRSSLLSPNSFLRRHGFYGSLITEERKKDEESRTTVCFGVSLPFWIILPSVSLALIAASLQDGRSFRWSLRVQYRVSITSPLMKACQNGDVALMRQILNDGRGGINDRTMCLGKTPISVAISGQHFEAVKWLLEQGADPNIPDDDQVSPIFAVTGMNPTAHSRLEQLPPTWDRWLDTFRLLIKHGAPASETVRGRNLAGLNVEKDGQPSKTLEFLRILAIEDPMQLDVISGSQCWSALHNALRCRAEAVEALALLHASGVNLSRIMDDGRTALHLATMTHTSFETLEYLCADTCSDYINRQDQWGWTPLHYAVVSRSSSEGAAPYSNAVALLRKGADPMIKASSNSMYIYDQPTGSFTAFEILRHVRPARFQLLVKVLQHAGIGIQAERDENITQES